MNWNIIYLIYPFICRVKTWQIVIRDCMPLFEPENIFHTRWCLENFVPFILYSLRLSLGLSQSLFWDTKGYSVLAFFLKMHRIHSDTLKWQLTQMQNIPLREMFELIKNTKLFSPPLGIDFQDLYLHSLEKYHWTHCHHSVRIYLFRWCYFCLIWKKKSF